VRHYATTQKVAGSIRDVIGHFKGPKPFSRNIVLGSNQPLTEMSTRILSEREWRAARKAGNLTVACEPIV
jgi:hypothetical protein